MFNKKTVMVIGAGASNEAGLPTGHELKSKITSLLDFQFDFGQIKKGDSSINEALRIHLKNSDRDELARYARAAWHVRDAMPQAISIDNFIDAHGGDKKIELCGKLAIVRSILQAERHSLLYFDRVRSDRPHPDYKRLEDTWYNKFFQLLTENCRVDDLFNRMERVALIVFNYDRCIEQFLFHALQNYYKISEKEAAELVNRLEIYHPYGKVGFMPWQRAGEAIEFGMEPSSSQLLSLAAQIKTFTEGTDPTSSEVTSIRRSLLDSNIVVFLGFAFHRLNLELIAPKLDGAVEHKSAACFATAKGISSSDCKSLENELREIFGFHQHKLNIRNDLVCKGLFQEYWRGLSLS
ncbi:MAG: hypothetical protein ABIK08_13030 [Pseudomonadota bacterium]